MNKSTTQTSSAYRIEIRPKTRKKKTIIAFIAVLSISAFSLTAPAQVRDLGIDSFLDQLPPNAGLGFNDPATGNILAIDLYGKNNTLLGLGLPTVITGRVTARDVGGGNEQVTIALHAKDALCYGYNGDRQPALGYDRRALVNGEGPAALGDTTYRFVMAPAPAGQFNFDIDSVVGFFVTINCRGLLRAGSGYPEGTPGLGHTTQIAFIGPGCPLESDGFCVPTERIHFRPTGN